MFGVAMAVYYEESVEELEQLDLASRNLHVLSNDLVDFGFVFR
jgi:hypothetical protein